MAARIRRIALGVALLLLGGCIPREKPPQRPTGETVVRECLADLTADGAVFRQLPDRTYAGGCRTVGSVQLLDIGVPVTNAGAMTCGLAVQFERWLREAVQPAAASMLNSHVKRIESFGTFSCRPLNGQVGARLSEHGHANAIDVGAFQLADGRRITVLDGWNGPDPAVRRFLRAVHDAGCRRFAVVLGPDANALHRNHLHFDMGAGPYCR